MGQLVKGFRPGITLVTDAGAFRNGSNPTSGQAAALKAAGYTLEKSSTTLEPLLHIGSTMRKEQIDVDTKAREAANKRADEIASKNAATQPDGSPKDGDKKPADKKPADKKKGKGAKGDAKDAQVPNAGEGTQTEGEGTENDGDGEKTDGENADGEGQKTDGE